MADAATVNIFSGFLSGYDPARGSGQEAESNLAGRAGSVRRCSKSHGSGREVFKYHGVGPSRADPIRPARGDPTRANPSFCSAVFSLSSPKRVQMGSNGLRWHPYRVTAGVGVGWQRRPDACYH